MEIYETLRSEKVYEGKLIDVVLDSIRLPNGKEALREVVVHGPAAAVLPVDSTGRLVLVRQYRHPAKSMSLEIPAGLSEPDEDPAACAVRELLEETGLTADKLTFLFKFYASIGFCTEILYLYIAEGLHEGEQNLDEDEFVTIERLTPDEVLENIASGCIVDAKTIAAVLGYLNLKRPS
ncbi:MAG: NUDIX hydrolase [Clostridiales bacterium]|jgi:ADP-ribose pyrophosphatase|nr:NUDIX hydrolase [Clostridiales bacterium]